MFVFFLSFLPYLRINMIDTLYNFYEYSVKIFLILQMKMENENWLGYGLLVIFYSTNEGIFIKIQKFK
jgi:hypothetical protein